MGTVVQDEDDHKVLTLNAYWRFLKSNRPFRLLFLGEVVNSCGSWFNYVSCMTIVHRLGGDSALLISGVVIIRVLPAALLFPFAGVVADRFDRVRVLIVVCLLSAAIVSALVLIQSPAWLWLLYVLLFIQFSLASFYDPARRALTPLLVRKDELPLSATLDAFGWSLMAAVGASIGGLAVSSLGTNACFIIDACTFLVAAACSHQLQGVAFLPQDDDTSTNRDDGEDGLLVEASAVKSALQTDIDAHISPRQGKKDAGSIMHGHESWSRSESPDTAPDSQLEMQKFLSSASGTIPSASQDSSDQHPHSFLPGRVSISATAQVLGTTPGFTVIPAELSSSQPFLELRNGLYLSQQPNSQVFSHTSQPRMNDTYISATQGLDAGTAGLCPPFREHPETAVLPDVVTSGCSEELDSLWEGSRYLQAPQNRDVAVLVFIKASGSLVWGASDVLYVRFSELPLMQIVDAATTMGVIFSCVGIGAFLGPVLFNLVTPPKSPFLERSTAGAFSTLFVGYILMTVAPSITFLLPAVGVRSLGSATLWVYSTLLLQYRVENRIQGRVFAVEMALYTVAETVSGIWGGSMFDQLALSTQGAAGVMSIVAAVITVVWSVYAWRSWQRHSKKDVQAVYELVAISDGLTD